MGQAIDDFLKTADSAPTEPEQEKKPTDSDFTAWATGEDTANQLGLSATYGMSQSPEEAARLLRLQARTGLPEDLLQRNLDTIETEAKRADFDPIKFREKSPIFAEWLAENPNHFALAKEDLTHIGMIEGHLRNIYDQFKIGRKTTELKDLGVAAMMGTITPAQRQRQAQIETEIEKTNTPADYGITGFFAEVPGAIANQIPIQAATFLGAGKGAVIGAGAGAAAGATVGGVGGPATAGVGAAAGATAGIMTGWRLGAGVEAGKMEAALAYLDYEKLKDDRGFPLDRETALGAATATGIINGALELVPFEALAKTMPMFKTLGRKGIKDLLRTPTLRAAFKTYGKHVLEVALKEGGTEYLQEMVKTTAGEIAQMVQGDTLGMHSVGGFLDRTVLNPKHIEAALQSMRAGMQSGGGMAAVTATTQFRSDIADAKRAEAATQSFLELGKKLQETKILQKAPEVAQDLVARLVKDGPAEKVYAPIQQWNEYWQSKGADPREVAEHVIGANTMAYDEAMQSGADLVIPTERYAVALAPTEHNAFFANELRSDPLEMNGREAKELIQKIDEQERAKQAEAQQTEQPLPMEQQKPSTAGPSPVFTQVQQQLKAAGYTEEQATLYSKLNDFIFKTSAARSGLDPTALFKSYGLLINGPGTTETTEAAGTTSESGNQGEGGTTTFEQAAIPAAQPELSPLGFYSQIAHEVSKMDFTAIPAKDLVGRISNIPGIKAEELEFSGLLDYLKLKQDQGEKVSKEEVQEFLAKHGVQVNQVVLGGDFEGTSAISGLEWGEMRRDHSRDADDIESEYESLLHDTSWVKEQRENEREALISEYTDEEGIVDERRLEKAIDEAVNAAALSQAESYVESDDYAGAEFTVKEHTTGWTLSGSDERGWFSDDAQEQFDTSLEEAKIRLTAIMIEKGEIEGDPLRLSQAEDVQWRSPRGLLPSYETLTKKVNALFKKEKDRFIKESKADTEYWALTPDITEADYEKDARDRAVAEVEATYEDPNNARNTISIQLSHPLLKGRITGNNKKGYVLKISEPKEGITDLEAKTIEDAKTEALEKLILNKLVAAPHKGAANDVNTPVGPSRWKKYRIEGGHNYREILLTLPNVGPDKFTYSTHFKEENFVAHVRVTDHVDDQGRKTLLIEELQSDWHQQGRERGYKEDSPELKALRLERRSLENKMDQIENKSTPEYDALSDKWHDVMHKMVIASKELPDQSAAVPNAPFKNTEAWATLAMKRMIRMAVEQGYDAVAWVPAEVHVERWGTDSIGWVKKEGGDKRFAVSHDAQGQMYTVLPEGQTHGRPVEDGVFKYNKIGGKTHEYGQVYSEKDALEAAQAKAQELNEQYAKPYFLVGSVEQRGGNVEGMNIEETARTQGKLLERHGERVTTQAQLHQVISNTLGRQRNTRALESLTESIWKQMQEKEVGSRFPRKEGMEFFYDKLIPRKVVPAILKKLDPNATIEVTHLPNAGSETRQDGMEVLTVPITQAMRQKAQSGFTLFQPAKEGLPLLQPGQENEPRGKITFNGKEVNLDILRTADLSTFLHETGHFYLEVLGDLAALEAAAPDVKSDYSEVLKWLGVESREQIKKEHHEKFARGFEAYLREGRAPSPELRTAFAHFKDWLTKIYKKFSELNVTLTPEVKGVFDRLIATQAEIEAAQVEQSREALFANPFDLIMNEKTAQQYQDLVERAKIANIEQAKVIQDVTRKREKEYRDAREIALTLTEEQVNQMPEYIALSILQKGVLPDGTPVTGDLAEMKLSRSEISNQYGKERLDILPRGITQKEGGLNPDVAASLLGFKNGDSLLLALSSAENKEELINRRVDEQMKERFGDNLTDGSIREEAMKTIHNDQNADRLKMEMDLLASENMPTFKGMVRRVARRVPTVALVRAHAQQAIAKKMVKDLSPHIYQRAEARSANEAMQLFLKGDLEGAFEAKQRELLNHELYRAAVDAKESVESSLTLFKKLERPNDRIAKTRDMDLVNTARAILSSFGIGKADRDASYYTDQIKRYDPETYETVAAQVQSATERAKPYKEVSYSDFTSMAQTIEAMWDLAKSAKEVEIEGKILDRDLLKTELMQRISEIMPKPNRVGYDRAVSQWDQTKMGLLGIKAALTRVEAWTVAMGGPFKKYIFDPISKGATDYREARKVQLEKYLAIVKSVEQSLSQKEIAAPEIGYTFSGKAELLGAMLHTGNESNMSKLLRGRKWGSQTFEGSLDSSRWNSFITRLQADGTLTKADYDYLQGVWNLFESLKHDAQKAHKKMYGEYFSEITAKEFTTPFGTYKGGYVPAMADPFLVPDAAIRDEKAELGGDSSFMFPTSGRGWAKNRVENYTVPLVMDLRMVPMHIDKVLRFVHIEPHVKAVARIVMDREFRAALNEFDPTIAGDMLVPWLGRAAQQKITLASKGWGGKATDTFFRELRTRTGLQVMTANVVNALQQVTGLSMGAVQVERKYLRNALWTYIKAPAQVTEDVTSKSAFMRTRTTTQSMEIQQTIDDLLLNPTKYEEARAFAMKHGYFLQAGTQNVVDIMVWSGAYEQAVTQGVTEEEAVRRGDSAVRLTQGSFNAEDISRFETGTPFVRAFTMFYSYFNMQANLLGSEFTKLSRDIGLKKGAGRALYIYTFGFMIPAVISEALVKMMSGKGLDEDDDDSYLDDLLALFFGSQFRTATAMFPFVGPVVNAGVNSFNNKWYDDRLTTSPAVAMIESSVSAPHSVYKAITENGSKKKAARDTLTLMGLLSGLPLAPLSRPLGYVLDINEGNTQPQGVIDLMRGLVTGRGSKQ